MALIISHYGLYAVFAGAMLEGETLLLVAGYAAHRGYLDLEAVVAVAWAGAVAGDQLFFALGRRYGQALIARRATLAARVGQALRRIDRHASTIVFAMRFLWGSRMILPIALGMTRTPRWRFLCFDLAAALVWSTVVTGVGYFFGAIIAGHAAVLHRYEHWGIALVLLAAGVWHGLAWWRRHSGARR